MKYNKALFALVIAFSLLAFASIPQTTEHKTSWLNPCGNASAVNDTALQEGINESIEDYVPMVVGFTLLGLALSALLGASWIRRNS